MGLSRVPITARDDGKVGKAGAKSHAGANVITGTIQPISEGGIVVAPLLASGLLARCR